MESEDHYKKKMKGVNKEKNKKDTKELKEGKNGSKKGNEKQVTIALSKTGNVALEWDKVYDVLSDFAAKDTDETIEFPSFLTPPQRKNIHMLAERLNLEHSSIGTGENRCIQISKKKAKDSFNPIKEDVPPRKRKNDKIPVGVSEIVDGFLYLGSMNDAYNKEDLLLRKIKYVLNCAKETKNYHMDDPSIEYHRANLVDVEEQNFVEGLEDCLAFIAKAKSSGSAVLVHCVVGKSRSASIVIAYLMKGLQMTLNDAYHHVKGRRPMIQPNEGFMKQLLQLELMLYQKNSMQHGDWVPLVLGGARASPTKPKPTLEEIQQLGDSFVQRRLSTDFLTMIVEKECDGSYEKKYLGTFMAAIAKHLASDPEIEKELADRGIKWNAVAKRVNDSARHYYVRQMERQSKGVLEDPKEEEEEEEK